MRQSVTRWGLPCATTLGRLLLSPRRGANDEGVVKPVQSSEKSREMMVLDWCCVGEQMDCPASFGDAEMIGAVSALPLH